MNKRLSISIGLLFLLSSILLAQPKMKILQGTSLDMGDVVKGQKGEKIVTIKNIGNDTLRITNVHAQCGCTATLLKNQIVGPGDSTQLSIGFNAQNQSGKVTKGVDISSNDTSGPKITIQFVANVIEVLKFTPDKFMFDRAKLDSTYTKTITISNPSKDHAIKILSVNTKFESIKLTLMKNTLLPGEETQLQGVFHATKAGNPRGTIELTTDSPLQNLFTIIIFAWVTTK